MIKKGDILLVKYNLDPIGWLIRKFTKSNWNHVAWVLNKYTVIESCRKGIILTPISKYKNKILYETKLKRIKNISKKDLDIAINIALKFKRKRNYFKLLLTFINVYLKINNKLPDVTCSGLISYCLSKVSFYFNKNKHPLMTVPEDINKCRRLYNV